MARINIINRSAKKEGKIALRFRLRDGRDVDLYHKSEIEADLGDLSKFELDGTPKKRANYNRKLHKAISERMSVMEAVYSESVKNGKKLTNESFEEAIDRFLSPDKYKESDTDTSATMLSARFERYINEGLFSEGRKAGYWVTFKILNRFLTITGQENIQIGEVAPNFLISLRDFIINEYKYAKMKKWRKLYENVKENNIPNEPRSQNTTAIKLKMLQAFFAQLEDADEIGKSPFRKMGKENRQSSLREQYVAPIALTYDEVRLIKETEVCKNLAAAKAAFLLQCALGCRISDFKAMSMDNVAVSPDGIPYVRYVARKTSHKAKQISEVKTPLIRFAFDIVKESGFNLPILNNVSGMNGFNKKIKELLQFCGIVREVEEWNESLKKIVHTPLYATASSKLGRKTNVTLMSRVQINTTITGLHAEGSDAVSHYYDKSLSDVFLMLSVAFGEKTYKVDKQLNVVDA